MGILGCRYGRILGMPEMCKGVKIMTEKEDYITHLESMIELDGYISELGFIPLKEPHRNNIKWLLKGLKYKEGKS